MTIYILTLAFLSSGEVIVTNSYSTEVEYSAHAQELRSAPNSNVYKVKCNEHYVSNKILNK